MFYTKVYGWLLIMSSCGALQAAQKKSPTLAPGVIPVEVPRVNEPGKYDKIDIGDLGKDGDAARIDPISQASFCDLRKERDRFGKPLIIARVLLGSGASAHPVYYEAKSVNQMLFGSYPVRDELYQGLVTSDGSLRVIHDSYYIDIDGNRQSHSQYTGIALDPTSNQTWKVDKIHYFILKPGSQQFTYFCSLRDLTNSGRAIQLRKTFQENAADPFIVGEALYWLSLRSSIPLYSFAAKIFNALAVPGTDDAVRKQALWYIKWMKNFDCISWEDEVDPFDCQITCFTQACLGADLETKIVGNLHAGILYAFTPEQERCDARIQKFASCLQIARQTVEPQANKLAGQAEQPDFFRCSSDIEEPLQKALLLFKAQAYAKASTYFQQVINRAGTAQEFSPALTAVQVFAHAALGYIEYYGKAGAFQNCNQGFSVADKHFTELVRLLYLGATDEFIHEKVSEFYKRGQKIGGAGLAFPVNFELARQHTLSASGNGSCSRYVRTRACISRGWHVVSDRMWQALCWTKQFCWSTPTRKVCTSLAVACMLGFMGKRYGIFTRYFCHIR